MLYPGILIRSTLLSISVFVTILLLAISAPDAHSKEPITVAYIGFSTDKPFWVNLGKAVKQEAAHRNINLIDLTPPSPDAEMQVKFLDHAIKKKVDGVILGANNPLLLQQILSQAAQSRIPVVAIDSVINHPAIKSFVATDNAKGAALAGEYIVAQTGGKGTVLILGGTANHPNGEARRLGVTEKAAAAGMSVIFRRTDWEIENAFLATSEELNKPNKISAIFSCWDPGIPLCQDSCPSGMMGLQ
jgi:ABC-type sugar transport system substrate-binding protein